MACSTTLRAPRAPGHSPADRTGRVYVTGMGVVSSLGLGRKAYWNALIEGRSGLGEVSLFDTSKLSRNIAGEVWGFVAILHPSSRAVTRAIRGALDDAGIEPRDVDVVCSSLGGLPPSTPSTSPSSRASATSSARRSRWSRRS